MNIIIQKISEAYLRIEVISDIGFEAKQEMKSYYNIVHQSLSGGHFEKVDIFFSRWSHPCE